MQKKKLLLFFLLPVLVLVLFDFVAEGDAAASCG